MQRSRLVKLSKAFFSPFLWILYLCVGFIPRSHKIIVYGSPGERFSDNAKYAFLNNSLGGVKGVDHWWITGSASLEAELKRNGLNVAKRWSCKGVYLCIRAKEFHFSSYVSDVNFWVSRGAVKVNYWHGLPFKKIEYDIDVGPLSVRYHPRGWFERVWSLMLRFVSPAQAVKPDFLYSPHSFFDSKFVSAFRVSSDNLVKKRYPRVEYLMQDNNKLERFARIGGPALDAEAWNAYSKVILYAPTFRDANKNWISENVLDQAEVINRFLVESNSLLLIKPHPNEFVRDDLSMCSNMVLLDSQLDTYVVLRSVDILVTDYSSISIDAAEAGLEVYLVWPDLCEYSADSRGFYFNMIDLYGDSYFNSMLECLETLAEGCGNKSVHEILLSKIDSEVSPSGV